MLEEIYDVVIVGYGPAGAVATSTLGEAGHKVAVLERQRELYPLPRMATFDGESARTIQATGDGIDEALEDALVMKRYRFGDADENELFTFDWDYDECGFPSHMTIFQPDIEANVQAKVDRLANVDVFRGTELVTLVQQDDFVELVVQPRGSIDPSQRQTIKARFVIGADGANSTVRQLAGIELTDHNIDERWMNYDMNILRPLPEKMQDPIIVMDPKRPHMYMPLGSKRQRFEARVADDEPDEALLGEEWVWETLERDYGLGREDMSICRQVVYHFRTRLVEDWRRGRVFLAGDAAHTMTPYMGQGGCSAIRDGRNLAWKLSLVLSGTSEATLLDQYQIERKPHVTAILFGSHDLAKMINVVDPEAAASRDEFLRSGAAAQAIPPFPKLEGGVLHREPDGTVSAVSGSLAPQGRLGKDGREERGDELLGHNFQLISRTRPALSEIQWNSLTAIGCKVAVLEDASDADYVEDLDGAYRSALDAFDADFYISRPDWYIFGAGRHSQAAEFVDELFSALSLKIAAGVPVLGGV